MWISKENYNSLRENAEKNIDEECALLKKKYNQGQDAIETLKECANTLKTFNRIFGASNENNVNLYYAYYKRQRWDKDNCKWEDTWYNRQGIVVIANSYDDAKVKVEKCLSKVEKENYRAVLVGNITECIGLDIRYGFEDSLDVNPIVDD